LKSQAFDIKDPEKLCKKKRTIFAKEKIIIRDKIERIADLKKYVSRFARLLESRRFPQRCLTSVRRIDKRRIARC